MLSELQVITPLLLPKGISLSGTHTMRRFPHILLYAILATLFVMSWIYVPARIRDIIKDGFADPDFGPREVAAETGISLRYLQKLFTARGSTCSEFIYSLRLDHAARLLHRRASLETSQPLSEIAYACGFRDYTHFARRFRHQFGYPPGGRAERETVRAGTGERASRAHDVQPPAV